MPLLTFKSVKALLGGQLARSPCDCTRSPVCQSEAWLFPEIRRQFLQVFLHRLPGRFHCGLHLRAG